MAIPAVACGVNSIAVAVRAISLRRMARPCTCSLRVIWLALSGAVRMMFTRQS
jgi:hypothetical protein